MSHGRLRLALAACVCSVIALPADGRTLFWSNPNDGTVGRVEVDGTGLRVLAVPGGRPNALAVDVANRQLLWANFGDGFTSSIQRADFDGTCAGDLVASGAGSAQGLALAGAFVYWGTSAGAVWSAHVTGAPVKEVINGDPALLVGDLEADFTGGKLYWTNDLSDATALVQRANFDGTGVEDLVPASGSGATGLGVDLEGGKIYWVEPDHERIRRSNLDGSGVEIVLNAPGIHDLALDAPGGTLYWSDGDLRRANLDGTGTELVVQHGGIFGLVLWPDTQRAVAAPAMNRFIAFETRDATPGAEQAVRVRLARMYNTDPDDPSVVSCPPRGEQYADLSAFEGAVRWLGPPNEYADNGGTNFAAAQLQCCPHYRDWSETGLALQFAGSAGIPGDSDTFFVYGFGAEVVPCSIYEVQLLDKGCGLQNESCYSEAIRLDTSRWGDISRPLQGPGTRQPNVLDLTESIDRFRGFGPGCQSLKLVQALLRGNVPTMESQINVMDVTLIVDGFRSLPYAQVGPSTCGPCE